MAVKKKAAKKKSVKKKKAVRKPPITALAVGGKTFKAGKGYYFQKSGNGVALMRAGVKQANFTCECNAAGGCRVEMNGPTATCLESGCSGSCGWVINVPGLIGWRGMSVLA